MQFDVVIIGGGPAGLAAGIGLARNGFKTALFEKKRFPVDKACGEGVMPPGVELLRELGALDAILNAGARWFDGISYVQPGQRKLEASFVEGPGLAIRRTILSKALFDVASQTSLSIFDNSSVSGIVMRDHEAILSTSLGKVSSQLVVGADGIRSLTRAWLGLDASRSNLRRYGVTQHYAVKPWNNKVEVYPRNGFEAYLTPCGDNEVGLGFLWDTRRYDLQAAGKSIVDGFLCELDEVRDKLSDAVKIGPTQAIGHFHRPVAWPIARRGALIGDAAGYVDPATGEGISLGLRSAKLLVQCLSENKPLSWYANEVQKSRRAHVMTTHAMLWFAKRPSVRGMAINVLAQNPRLFQRLLSLNMGA